MSVTKAVMTAGLVINGGRSGRGAAAAAARTAGDRYTAEEAQLTGEIATEQERWTDINARLDELERAPVKR